MWTEFHRTVTEPLAAAGIPFAITPGNHDASAYPNFAHERAAYRVAWADHRPDLDFGPVQNDPRCGLNAARRNVAQRRIVGGDEAGFGSFPWQAYVRIGEEQTETFEA